jgi:hypothetical protein
VARLPFVQCLGRKRRARGLLIHVLLSG